MTHALIVYHSMFGNTKAVADCLAKGMRESGIEVDCLSIDDIEISKVPGYDFLVIGGPTHMIGISKPMKAFLEQLKTCDLQGMKGFCFDTRNPSRLNKSSWLMLENSAARRIEGILKRMKIEIIYPRESALVEGREGPLLDGAEARFRQIGVELADLLH